MDVFIFLLLKVYYFKKKLRLSAIHSLTGLFIWGELKWIAGAFKAVSKLFISQFLVGFIIRIMRSFQKNIC